jgi:hypothetical protein
MWRLLFRDGGVVIAGSSLIHARLLAAANGLGRASRFVEGNFIDTERLPPIPPEFVGRMLAPIEARQLQEMLDSPREHGTERRRNSKRARPQNRAS